MAGSGFADGCPANPTRKFSRGRRTILHLRAEKTSNVAQAFGHEAAGGGRNINANTLTF
jgi:hypothetical protein